MYADLQQLRNLQPLLIYLLTFLMGLAFYFPMQEVHHYQQAHQSTIKLTHKIMMVRQGVDMPITLDQLFAALDKNPYTGTWSSDMKQSKLLEQDDGTIEIMTRIKGPSANSPQGYYLYINIFDGQFRDSGHYQLEIQSEYIRSNVALTSNQFIFEAKSHLIGQYQHTRVFLESQPQTLYIDKLKFRICQQFDNHITIQLLIGAQNDINIITSKMNNSNKFVTEIQLTLFICMQIGIQLIGVHYFHQQIKQCEILCKSLSVTMMQYLIGFDLAQLGALVYLFLGKSHIQWLSIPIALLFYQIFWPSIGILHTISPIAGNGQGQQQVSLRKSLTHYSTCVVNGLCTFLLFYLNNMRHYLFIIFFAVFLFPQIHNNFKGGLKITYGHQQLFMFATPRLLTILPLRVFTKAFMLQSSYVFAIMCCVLVGLQVLLLHLQKIYGSRSILPKFLTPKGLSSFKFFMNQDDNCVCYLCQSELKSIPSSLLHKSSSESIMFTNSNTNNRVVVTPCNHKFHVPCLLQWMQTSQYCPLCESALPPIDEHEEDNEDDEID